MTYMGNGDPALANYYPAWLDNLANDVTLEGSAMDGFVQGPEAARTVLVAIRTLYDYQDFHFAGPYGDNGWLEDYTAGVRGEPISNVTVVTRNAAGQAQHVVGNYRPRSALLLLSRLVSEKLAGTPYAEHFLAPRVLKRTYPRPPVPNCGTTSRCGGIMGYSDLRNEMVSAANGTDYAYRDTGSRSEATVPLVLLQHFRGNLDSWDPALIDALAQARRVVTFDNVGVGGSTGTTPDTIEQMARDVLAFLAAMGLSEVDLLGFSIGSFVAQQIALTRPAMVRRLVLASAAPQGAAGMHGWAPEVMDAVGTPHTSPEAYLKVFFARSGASRQAGKEALQRMYARTEDRDTVTTWATREAQYDAVCIWGIPITRCCSGSVLSTCRCSWPTATATR